jgi:hypothetical protein
MNTITAASSRMVFSPIFTRSSFRSVYLVVATVRRRQTATRLWLAARPRSSP